MKKLPFENGKDSRSRKINVDEAQTPDNSEASAESMPYKYEDVYGRILEARNAGVAEFQNALRSTDKDGRIKSGEKVQMRVIEVEKESKITPKEAKS